MAEARQLRAQYYVAVETKKVSDLTQALENERILLAAFRADGRTRAVSATHGFIATIFRHLEQYDSALVHIEAGEEAARPLGEPLRHAIFETQRASVALAQADTVAALGLFCSAWPTIEKSNDSVRIRDVDERITTLGGCAPR